MGFPFYYMNRAQAFPRSFEVDISDAVKHACFLDGAGSPDFRERMRQVAYWLSEPGLLTFDDEPALPYHARIYSAIPLERALSAGLLSCYPLAGGGVEPNDGYYERWAVSLDTPRTEGDAQVAKNSGSFSFPAFSSWGKVTHFGFFDAKTGGNLLLFGELNTAVTVHKGDVLMNYSGMLEAAMR